MELKQFLQSAFNKQDFIQFISERFYGFAPNLQEDEYLGKVKLDDKSEIGFFVFEVEDDKDIEHNRVYLSSLAAKEIDDKLLDGAISVFYNSKDIWRLTFVRFSYNNKNKKEITNKKRFTYILGIQAINTPLTQFKKDKDYRYKTILEIQDDFSVEKVSKEFFEEYRGVFEKLNENLKPQMALFGTEEELHAFSKKLLGRIIFLYFLQKKGWLGVKKDASWGDGDKSFLSNIYKKRGVDFYAKQLCNLFFETLNKKREDDYAPHFECKIPFLNGGLFDKNQKYDESVFIDDTLFGEIFETFDRYNFTILEDSPDESEIAIDPEMLGRVFENLLEENYRKGKGAFYTPREIVSYMCKSSIEHYLENATKEHQYIFGVDEFLNLSALDDEKIKDFYLKHPQKYIVLENYFEKIEPYKNLVVHFRVVAKLRGFYKDTKSDTLVKSEHSGHNEIDVHLWQKILKKEYLYHSHIIGSNKEIRLNNKLFVYPTILKYIQIEGRFFALAFLPNIFGDLELNTIFPIREKGIKNKTKQQETIINLWDNGRFAFDKKVQDDLKSLWRDCRSPHTVPHKSGEHNTASRFSMISHKLFKSENILDKDLRKHLDSKWYDLKINKILNNSSITQNDLIDIMLKKIKQIKVLDPAIGSGAFPMGMLHEIVQTRVHLGDKTPYARLKREIIENSIYGVDIDSDAVEIAKLRFWLSLTVDEMTPSPLPNLDFKIMQGNSLIETINGFDIIPRDIYEKKEKKQTDLFGGFAPQTLFDDKVFDVLVKKIHEFYSDTTGVKKQSDKEKIKELVREIIESYLREQERDYASREKDIQTSNATNKKKLADKMSDLMQNIQTAKVVLNELLKNNFQTKELFLYKLFFGEVLKDGGFDIVIGNPPYIMEDENRLAFDGLRNSPCYQGKTDIWHLFTCKAFELLKEKGYVTYIAKNQWLHSSSASKMRENIYEKANIIEIVDFKANMVFESVGQQTMIFLLEKNSNNLTHEIRYKSFPNKLPRQNVLQLLMTVKPSDDLKIAYKSLPKLYDSKANLTFSNSDNETILLKIEALKNFEFDEKKEMIQGIIGGPDEAFIVKCEDLATYNENEKKYLKMLHTNTGKYYTNESEKYIFYISKKNFDDKNIEDFPNIKAFFEPNKAKLEDAKVRYKTSSKPYLYLHRERDESFFKKGDKIVWAKRTEGAKFTFTNEPFYGTANLFFINSTRVNLKYITALLNSKLMYFYMHERLKHTGDLLQIDKNQFMKIPLFIPKGIKPFVELVDKIMEVKKVDSRVKHENDEVKELENQIDEMVYELYGLSEDEIKTVKGEN